MWIGKGPWVMFDKIYFRNCPIDMWDITMTGLCEIQCPVQGVKKAIPISRPSSPSFPTCFQLWCQSPHVGQVTCSFPFFFSFFLFFLFFCILQKKNTKNGENEDTNDKNEHIMNLLFLNILFQ